MVIHVHLLLIPLLLLLAAIFAAGEASLFSLSRSQLESMRDEKPNLHAVIRALAFRPDALLSTFIIGNEFLSILVGSLVTTSLEYYFGHEDVTFLILVSVASSSFLLLTVSEILPKVLAFRLPVLTASILAYPMYFAHTLFTPLRKVFLGISGRILRFAGIEPTPPAVVSEKDFLTMVEVGAESGSLEKQEKELIVNVFRFGDATVGAVMTPWRDVFHLSHAMSIPEILRAVREKNFSRIPVLAAEGKGVVGILYTKALLRLLLDHPESYDRRALDQAIFPPYIVSVHKKISALFREMKLKKVHIALVVDEFGKQLGVVTLEDILDALFSTQKREVKA